MARKRTNTPTKPDDIRSHRSIDALQTSLLELIEEKPFDQISIRHITDAAGLSYPTFFRRFASREELLRNVASVEVTKLLTLGHSAFDKKVRSESGKALCEYVQQHRKLWTALLAGGAAPFVREEFLRVAKDIANSRPRVNPWLPLDLAVAYITSGIFELLAWWMRQPEDYSIENVIILFDALIIDSAGRPRNIKLT